MKQFFFSFLLMVFVLGCGQTNNGLVRSTFTAIPAITTIKATLTPAIPTETPKPSPTSLHTSKPYIIKLFQGAGDGADEIYLCKGVYQPFPRFALYEDGQLIYYQDDKLLETFLTMEEINNLLRQIEETGYFEIGNSPEEHYDLPEDLQYGDGGWGMSVSVKGKSVDIHQQLTHYVVEPIQSTVNIIQTYQPTGNVQAYLPKNIELWTATLDSSYFPTPEPSENIVNWFSHLPPLNQYHIRLSESETKLLMDSNFFSGVPDFGLFRQEGKTYWVLACPPWYSY